MHRITESGLVIRDNVLVTVSDTATGEVIARVSDHNTPLQYTLDGVAQWYAGVSNQGYNAVLPPTQMQLGSGSGATFTPVAGTLKTISYANFAGAGTGKMSAVTQYTSVDPTGTFTQAQWQDSDGNTHFMVNFATAISKTGTQNLTLEWTITTQAGT